MRIDPRGTMERQMRPAMEAEIREELQAALHREMMEKLNSVGIILTDDQKAKLITQVDEEENQVVLDLQRNTANLTGLDALKASRAIDMGTASLQPVGRLEGIVGTDRLTNSAASGS